MLVGQYFMRFGAAVYQYSPTFPRGGLSAVFAVEVFALMTGASLDVAVQYKTIDETSWTTFGSVISASAMGVHTLEVTGLREEVRLRFSVGGSNPTDTVYANVLAPQWRPY
jgi:hypothetical protein